jgi:glutamate N-acetyltransferase/amino-acid N-acetyltransferase
MFVKALVDVATGLAKEVARDGEGATKLITVRVLGARSVWHAQQIALAVANSSLVKTAIHGCDPNWGRIFVAAGNAGVEVDANKLQIKLQGYLMCDGGRPSIRQPDGVHESLKHGDVEIEVDIHDGPHNATVWTCDLSPEYVDINAHYTT